MKTHFENMQKLYGDANVRLPNSIFNLLSENLKTDKGKSSVQQVSFSYCYLMIVSFLYKYAHFVDLENKSYIQNSDIKLLLGYNAKTKSVDKIIKKDGLLDCLSLTTTTKDYPISFSINIKEKINNINIREFETISSLNKNSFIYEGIKNIVKNRNYEVKEPLFLTDSYYESDYGTLYSIERTHKINIKELLSFIFDDSMDNIDILLYFYIKSKCKGLEGNTKQIPVYVFEKDLSIDRKTFYKHLTKLKSKGYISVEHKEWKMGGKIYKEKLESNDYMWLGVN